MKKMISNIKTLAALLMAGAAFTACSGDDSIEEQQPANLTEPRVYTITIQATKGSNVTTRALSLDGKTLNATWKTGEKVDVYKVTENVFTKVGTLTAQADGSEVSLSGNLTGTINKDNNLAMFFNGGVLDYQNQTGTLEAIASKYDYATAYTKVSKIDGSNITVVDAGTLEEPIPFDNQQTIVKFTLKDKDGNLISMKSLTLQDVNNRIFTKYDNIHNESDSYGDITVTRATAGSEFFVAIKTEEDDNYEPSSLDLTLNATSEDNSTTYTYHKSNVTFENGKYYEITVKMTKQQQP